MKSFRLRILRALIATIGLTPVGLLHGDTKSTSTEGTPDALVQSALASELDGPSEVREQLLRAALKQDSTFAPARWQLGFVRWENEWLDLDSAARLAKGDEQMAAYRKRRDLMVDTADDHRAIAVWCRKNKLTAEARIHWLKVLEFDQSDPDALQALGLQLYNGQLLTRKQIEQEKIDVGNRLRAWKQWQPQFVKWRTAIERGNSKERENAVAKLQSVSDVAALPAIEAVFGNDDTELNLLLVEVAGRIADPASTQVLLRGALNSDAEPVRLAAIKQLKKRPLYTFVPQIAALMPGGLSTRFEIYVAEDGTVVHEHELFQQRSQANEHVFLQREVRRRGVVLAPVTVDLLAKAVKEATAVEKMAKQQEQINARLSRRIRDLLAETTDFKHLDNKALLLQECAAYNETYAPVLTPKPTRRAAFRGFGYTASCFPFGTPILTITGSMPIEKVKVGDRVLSQNPQTGELAYKTVQGVTLRPASPLVEIGVGSESIRTTRGHPFWVNGQGWVLAKQLQVGQYLHGIGGAVPIDRLSEAPAAEAYNLVVSDFDTYFVGQQRLLVHDNLPLEETVAIVPGMRSRTEVDANVAPTVNAPDISREQNQTTPK